MSRLETVKGLALVVLWAFVASISVPGYAEPGAEKTNARQEAEALNEKGVDAYRRGDFKSAERHLQRALSIREKALGPDHPDTATSLNNLAVLYRTQGAYAKAEPLYLRALAIVEKALGPEHPDTAASLNNLAGLYDTQGAYAKAQPLMQRALRLAATHEMPAEVAWTVPSNYAYLLAKQGQVDAAIIWGKQAVNVLQQVRSGLKPQAKELQLSFVEKNESVYRKLAGWLIDQGRIIEAQQVLTMLKEDEYFGFIRRSDAKEVGNTTVSLAGLEARIWQDYIDLSKRLIPIAKEHDALDHQERQAKVGKMQPLDAQQVARKDELAQQLKVGNQQFDRFLATLIERMKADPDKIAQTSQTQDQITSRHRQLLQALAKAGQRQAGILQYLVLADRVVMIYTAAEGVKPVAQSKIERKDLSQKITAFRQAINERQDVSKQSQELYALLIAPVNDLLEQSQVTTLMLVPDDILRYLPFAALSDGKQYLIERYALTLHTEAAPAASLAIKPNVSTWQVDAFGVSKAWGNHKSLPGVPAEMDSVKHALGETRSRVKLDPEFTKVALLDAVKSEDQAGVMHVASHFSFTPGSDASYLLLGDGKQLSLAEIKDEDVRFDRVDLFALSACETAVGEGKNANGIEVEGLGVLAQRQGAHAVLATLWQVSDNSTAVLMGEFYRQRLQGSASTKAQALQQAQISLLRGTPPNPTNQDDARGLPAPKQTNSSAPTIDPKLPWAHPYYWAPFVIMGNWL